MTALSSLSVGTPANAGTHAVRRPPGGPRGVGPRVAASQPVHQSSLRNGEAGRPLAPTRLASTGASRQA